MTFVPASRQAVGWNYAFNIVGGLVICLAGLALPRIGDTSEIAPAVPVVVGILAVLLAGVATAKVWSMVFRRSRRLGVGYTADGLYISSWFGAGLFPWRDIAGIRQGARNGVGPIARLVIVPVSREPDADTTWLAGIDRYRDRLGRIDLGYLACDPSLVCRSVEFYVNHAIERSELGTEVALERFRGGDFPGG